MTNAKKSAVSAGNAFGMTLWVTSAGTPPPRMSGTTWSVGWDAGGGRKSMSIEQYLVEWGSTANICFDCQRACGQCPLSARDPATEELLFLPVLGWSAKKSKKNGI